MVDLPYSLYVSWLLLCLQWTELHSAQSIISTIGLTHQFVLNWLAFPMHSVDKADEEMITYPSRLCFLALEQHCRSLQSAMQRSPVRSVTDRRNDYCCRSQVVVDERQYVVEVSSFQHQDRRVDEMCCANRCRSPLSLFTARRHVVSTGGVKLTFG